jgi:hypothetical protein
VKPCALPDTYKKNKKKVKKALHSVVALPATTIYSAFQVTLLMTKYSWARELTVTAGVVSRELMFLSQEVTG